MTIIVTGGAGFIGSNFCYHMLNKYPDYRIVCVACLTYAGNMSTLKEALENPNFKFFKTNDNRRICFSPNCDSWFFFTSDNFVGV